MFNVLIVDDEEDICLGVKSLINRMANPEIGEINLAHDGFSALEAIRSMPPDIIITDIKMIPMNGIELINKARTFIPDAHYIVLSGYSDYEYVRQAFKRGVVDYLLKPVGFVELQDLLSKITDSRHIKPDQPQTLIDRILLYMQENYTRNITLHDISETFSMNYSYVSQLIKKETGRTFSRQMLYYRIESAKKMLMDPTLRVNEIAWSLGFQEPQHFTRSFKRMTGYSPKEFRTLKRL